MLILFTVTTLAAGAPAVDSLLQHLDEQYKQTTDVRANVTLTQEKPQQGAKKTDMLYYRRDSDKSFLIVMTGPESEKGNGYLRVGDNFWMYRKNTRTFQHINRDESIGGSDAHGDDFEDRQLSDMYQAVKDSAGNDIITEEMLGKVPVWRFDVVAKVNDVDYPKKTYWVQVRKDQNSKEETIMLKEASYSKSGTLMQTTYYLAFTRLLGKIVPVKQLYIDNFEVGNKTIVEISGISTDKLDDNIFTKAYLENLSK